MTSPSQFRGRRSPVRKSVEQATARIQEIIDAAERVAEEIQHDAEAEAERYLAERRAEADRLAAEQADRLEAALAGLRGHLTRVETEGARLLAELERVLSELTATRARTAGEDEPPADDAGELRDAALIRATQLAVSGADRSEIEGVLQRQFAIADPAPLVDQILGG